jgi:hypothetical protein
MILFSTAEGAGPAGGVGMPVFPLAQAIEALRTMLATESGAASPR